MPALKFVMKQQSFFGLSGTIQNLFASNFMPNGGTSVLVVNAAKTLLEWTSGLNTFMTATGTGLKVNGGNLVKGTIVDVEYTGSTFSPSVMQMFGWNTKASKVQQTIDDILVEQATNGENILWTYDQFVTRLFDIRKQIVTGNDSSNIIQGGIKDDTLNGRGGDDTFLATLGDDIVNGGSGIDRITYFGVAGAGDMVADLGTKSVTLGDGSVQVVKNIQKLAGGDGDDKLTGNHAANTLEGNGGHDWIIGRGGDDVLNGGGGGDTIQGDGGNDFIRGGDGNDTIEGGTGDDEIFGEAGKDQIDGGDGKDTIEGNGGNDQIQGGRHNDIIKGGAGKDRITGDRGNDILDGGPGNDNFGGHRGEDTIFGGLGNDFINAGQDDDTMSGGLGNDLFVFSGNVAIDEGDDQILDFTSGDRIKLFDQNTGDVLMTPGTGTLITHKTGTILLDGVDLADLSVIQIGQDTVIEFI